MIYLKAFLIGGALCAIGQILIDKTKMTPARILVIYVLAGILLTGVGLYGPLVGHLEQDQAHRQRNDRRRGRQKAR